jgi:polysaccharide export outer membrane protein
MTWKGMPMNGSHKAMSLTIPLMAALVICMISAPGLLLGQEVQKAVVNDYKIGPNDLLEIRVFELPDLNLTVRVSEDGSITFSLLGRIEVAGYTAYGLEQKLATVLTEKYVPGGAHVSVFIREYQKISVIGAVGQPGMYELVGPTTLLQAIAQAGGLTALATDEVYVYRKEADGKQTIITIDLDDLNSGNRDLNIDLKPKDVISIPIDQTLNVFVYGEVRNPGAIPYLRSKKITLLQAIAQAGGTTEWAKRSKVVVKRKDRATGKEMKINVNLKKMIEGKVADIVLEEGDVVIVP